MSLRIFQIHGLDCAEEVATLKRVLAPLIEDDNQISFDVVRGRMMISADVDTASTAAVIEAVSQAGMQAEPWREGVGPAARQSGWSRWGKPVLALISGVCLVSGFVLDMWLGGGLLAALGGHGAGSGHALPLSVRALYGLGVVSGIWHTLPKAWYAVRVLRPDMNLLMAVAVVGAIAIGEWFEAGTVTFLFAVSHLLESWSAGRARHAIEGLLQSVPTRVRIRSADGSEREIPADQAAVGAQFTVRPGEKIPLDGRIVAGDSDVDQAPITGESVPVAKAPGDDLFAGTINGGGLLQVVSTRTADRTTLANIARLVTEAYGRRSPSEQWVEQFARVYTPVVMGLALAVFLVGPLALGGPWSDWLYRALVLLVIACPCALVISTPVSIVSAMAAAAREGVLVKGGVHMEAPARLSAIAFDKTGTLTQGRPRLVQLIPLNGHSEIELLMRAAALEANSNHPIADAILEAARVQDVPVQAAETLKVIPGKGASGHIDGTPYWLGSHRYLEERGQDTAEIHSRLKSLSDAGHTVVVVGTSEHVCGLISVADAPRPAVRQTIQRLRESGIKHMVMLTGDNAATANAIGHTVGIEEVRAELLPADKVTAMEALVARYGQVAMVGDGVNDAPAMARSSLGIAMGAAGSDAAIETADIALLSDDLEKLPWLIRHSRRTLAIIRQNIVLSLTVKAVFMLLAVAGYASLWGAIAADMGASLVVIFNGLRLLKGRV